MSLPPAQHCDMFKMPFSVCLNELNGSIRHVEVLQNISVCAPVCSKPYIVGSDQMSILQLHDGKERSTAQLAMSTKICHVVPILKSLLNFYQFKLLNMIQFVKRWDF